jgi:hypothetical protein
LKKGPGALLIQISMRHMIICRYGKPVENELKNKK